MECHHQIDVIKLENELYRRPFDWSRVHISRTASGPLPTLKKAATKVSARQLLSGLSQDENAMPAPLIQLDVGQQDSAERQRLSRDEARRLLSDDASFLPPPAKPVSKSLVDSPRRSEDSRSAQASPRQLRSHDKISDRRLTESYFQLQLQQHITLHHCSGSFAISDLWSDANLSSLARRLVRIRLQSRLASRSADTSRRLARDTSEQHTEKARRLFESATRKMMQDGFVTLAEVDQLKHFHAPTSSMARSADRYCLVTPEYLLRPLRKMLGNEASASPQNVGPDDIDHLTARLRMLDDRFRFVNRSIVRDSLALHYSRCTPIVID